MLGENVNPLISDTLLVGVKLGATTSESSLALSAYVHILYD